MKKFKFRLEQILRYRRTVRDEKLRVLTEANLSLREAEERLEYLEKEAINAMAAQEVAPVEQFVLRGMYAARIKEEIGQQMGVIAIRQETVQKAMLEYIEASKEVKALDTLKERQEREYVERVAHEEGKILDELATQRGNTMKNLN